MLARVSERCRDKRDFPTACIWRPARPEHPQRPGQCILLWARRRYGAGGKPVDTVELFRQLDDTLADVDTFVASEYRRARLAGLPIDIGKLVMQLEIALRR